MLGKLVIVYSESQRTKILNGEDCSGAGITLTESVYLPLTRGASFFSRDAYAPYRAGVVPVENGVWTVTVAVPNPPEGLCGMGLVVKASNNGTR